jgi:ribosomal protein S18 acetylase RimI-like enzyme
MSHEVELVSRQARFDDVQAIIELWKSFMEELHPSVPDSSPQNQLIDVKSWSDRLYSQISHEHIFILESGKDLIGFVGFIDNNEREWVPSGIAYIVDIYVLPEARMSEAASMLLTTLVEAAAGAGFREVWTNTYAWNRPAQSLFERLGFVPFTEFQIPQLKNQLYYKKTLIK